MKQQLVMVGRVIESLVHHIVLYLSISRQTITNVAYHTIRTITRIMLHYTIPYYTIPYIIPYHTTMCTSCHIIPNYTRSRHLNTILYHDVVLYNTACSNSHSDSYSTIHLNINQFNKHSPSAFSSSASPTFWDFSS